MSVVDIRNLQPRVNCLQSFKRSFCEKISDQSDPGGWSVVTRTIIAPVMSCWPLIEAGPSAFLQKNSHPLSQSLEIFLCSICCYKYYILLL